ncbi:MAG: chemotaxis protein CheX [Thermotogaceae bacterium]|nr:chemotaxis protein CheX [Thermotogaceae bacterium]
MDARIVNALLSAVVSTFTQVVHQKPIMEKPKVVKEITPKFEIITVIGFVGDLEGNVIYSFAEETAFKIISEMMGMPYNQLDELALSALGELGNMTTGALAINLEKVGIKVDLTPPTVVTGKDIKVSVDGIILNFPVDLFNQDDVELNLVLKK